MTPDGSDVVLKLDGNAAPPRSNGELVFAEPWQGRAFALGVALHERGAFEWSEFQERLIAQIARWESDNGGTSVDGTEFPYYELWLAALEEVLEQVGLAPARAVADLTSSLEAADRAHADAHARGDVHEHH